MAKLSQLSIVLLILVSCTNRKEYDIDFIYKKVPVVISLFNDNEPMKVFVLWNVNPTEIKDSDINIADTIKNAQIKIFENGIKPVELPYVDSLGCYTLSTFTPKTQTKYELEMTVPNYEKKITASTSIPVKSEITEMTSKYINGEDNSANYYEDYIKYIMSVDSKEGDYTKYYGYYSKLKYTSSYSGNIYWKNNGDIKIKDNRYYKNKKFYGSISGTIFMFDSRYFTDNKDNIELHSRTCIIDDYYENLGYSEPTTVLQSLSRDMYLYYVSYPEMGIRPGGVSEPDFIIAEMKERGDPGPTYSNIKYGAGIFAGYTEDTYILEQNCFNK